MPAGDEIIQQLIVRTGTVSLYVPRKRPTSNGCLIKAHNSSCFQQHSMKQTMQSLSVESTQ